MHYSRKMLYAVLVVGSLVLGGCSSLSVKETWHKTSGPGHQYKKLMILAIANDENRRKMFENIVVDELGLRGVTAVASHTQVKDLEKAKRDDIVAAVHATDADGVLTVRPVSVGDKTVTQQGYAGAPFGTTANGYFFTPGSKDFLQAMLQTNLYDSEKGELVWTATVDTYDADHLARISRDMGKLLAERLRRDGFL